VAFANHRGCGFVHSDPNEGKSIEIWECPKDFWRNWEIYFVEDKLPNRCEERGIMILEGIKKTECLFFVCERKLVCGDDQCCQVSYLRELCH